MKKAALFTAVVSLFFGSSLIGETKTDSLASGYNSPDGLDTQGSWDLFFAGRYLYWQPSEGGLELGRRGLLVADQSRHRNPYQMDFDYKSGLKLGLGTSFNYDNWRAYLEYTQLHTKDHRNIAAVDTSEYVIVPCWVEDVAFSASASWHLRYDILDLTLDRSFYSGTRFNLDAFGGLRGGWINQKYRFEYRSYYELLLAIDGVYSGIAKTNSWVIGPLGGISLKYLLGAGFRLFGDVAGSLLYQRLHTSIKEPTSIAGALLGLSPINAKEHSSQITPNINLATGIRWGTYFDNNNYYFDLSAAYEFQYYWNQNRMKKLFDTTASGLSSKAKDLMLQGLTLSARFDF